MSEVLSAWPGGLHVRNKYPWAEWLDGRVWCLHRGVDFTAALHSMQTHVQSVAHRRGKVVRTSVQNIDTLIIQAYTDLEIS